MGLLDFIEKAMFEQKSEAQKEEELKGFRVFDLPAPQHKFSWKMAWDLAKGKEVESRPNRYHYQDIMLDRGGNLDLVRVYKRQMSRDEAVKATLEFNNYMQKAVFGHSKSKKEEKEKKFSWSKFWEIIKNASDDEIKLARGKSKEFNDMIEKEEMRRNAHRKSVDISIKKNKDNQSDIQVLREDEAGKTVNLGRMYKKMMTEKEAQERKKRGENWRETDEAVQKSYVRFDDENTERER